MEEEEEEVGDGIEKHLTSLSGSTESVPSDQAVKEDLIEDASRTPRPLSRRPMQSVIIENPNTHLPQLQSPLLSQDNHATLQTKLERLEKLEAQFPELLTLCKTMAKERANLEEMVKSLLPVKKLDVLELENHIKTLLDEKATSTKKILQLDEENCAQKVQLNIMTQQIASPKTSLDSAIEDHQCADKITLEVQVKELTDTVAKYGDRLNKVMDKAKLLLAENQRLKSDKNRPHSPVVTPVFVKEIDISKSLKEIETQTDDVTASPLNLSTQKALPSSPFQVSQSKTLVPSIIIPTHAALESHAFQTGTIEVAMRSQESQSSPLEVYSHQCQTTASLTLSKECQSDQISASEFQFFDKKIESQESQTDSLELNGRDSKTESLELNGRESQTDSLELNGRESQTDSLEFNGQDSQTDFVQFNGQELHASILGPQTDTLDSWQPSPSPHQEYLNRMMESDVMILELNQRLNSLLESKESDRQTFMEQLSQLDAQLSSASSTLLFERQLHLVEKESLNSTLKNMQTAEDTATSANKAELQLLTETLHNSQQLLQRTQSNCCNLEEKSRSVQAELDRGIETQRQLEEASEIEIQNIQSRILALTSTISDMTLSKEQQTLASFDQTTQFSKATQELTLLQAQHAEDTKKMEKTIQLLRQSKKQILKLQEDCRESKALHGSLQSLINERDADLQSNQRKLVQMESEMKSIHIAGQNQNDLWAEERAGFLEGIRQLKVKMEEQEGMKNECQNKFEQFQRGTDHDLATLAHHQQLVERQAEKINSLQQKIEILEGELETSKRLFEHRSAEMDTHRAQCQEAESKAKIALASAQKQLNEKEVTRHALQLQLKTVLDQGANYVDRVKLLEQELFQKESAFSTLNASMQEKVAEMSTLDHHHAALKGHLSALLAEQHSLESEKGEMMSWKLQYETLSSEMKETETSAETSLHKLKQAVEDHRGRERSLRALNNTLKDEIRKLRDKSIEENIDALTPQHSVNINYEYVRNIIYRFLADPLTRPHLIPVLITIFHFTQAEQSRIQSATTNVLINTMRR